MRALLLMGVVAFVGCKSPSEAIIEAATGGKVDIKEGKVSFQGKDGSVTTVTDDGKGGGRVVVTNDKGETATVDAQEGQMRIKSKDGVAEWGTGKLPEGFPLPMLDGAAIQTSTKNSSEKGDAFHVIATSKDEPAAIADFYAKALKDKGFEKIDRSEHNMGGTSMVTLAARKKDQAAAVTVMREEGKDESMVTIAWGPK